MAEFKISIDACLGYCCNGGGVYVDGDGTVELDDDQVQRLVDLIKENDGETDIEELGLAGRLSDVYDALSEAYSDLARTLSYRHWATEGFRNGYFDAPEGLREQLEEDGLFKFDIEKYKEENPLDEDEEYDDDELEEARDEAFDEWLDDYTRALDDDALITFLESYYEEALEDYEPFDMDYDIEIPDEIVLMADTEE